MTQTGRAEQISAARFASTVRALRSKPWRKSPEIEDVAPDVSG
jgi:hypothetical protein